MSGPKGAHHVPTLNVANFLTLSRLLIVPLFVAALLAGGEDGEFWRITAAVLFAVASITDQVDGWVARKYGLVTDFGKIADPIADKALIGAALIVMSLLGELPWWITIVIGVRELGVTALRFWVIRHGVIPASRGGKAKTIAQIVAIGLFLLPLPEAAEPVRWIAMGIALALTVVTGIDYVVRAVRLRALGGKVAPPAQGPPAGGQRSVGQGAGAEVAPPQAGRTDPDDPAVVGEVAEPVMRPVQPKDVGA